MKWPLRIKIGIAATVVALVSSITMSIVGGPDIVAAGLALLGQAIGVWVSLMMNRVRMDSIDHVSNAIERAKSVVPSLDRSDLDRINESAVAAAKAMEENRA